MPAPGSLLTPQETADSRRRLGAAQSVLVWVSWIAWIRRVAACTLVRFGCGPASPLFE